MTGGENIDNPAGSKEWGEISGDNVISAALLDRLLHRAPMLEIAGNSYLLREHADLVPETVKRGGNSEEATKRKPGRPRKNPLSDSVQH